jgi:ubiquinone/menaquinone biosynthesis C-methylase UbiE
VSNDEMTAPRTKGLVMHSEARYYDLLAWILTLGRERAFRQRLVDLARLQPGDKVLDIGCGTGTLAVVAKQRVGPEGIVDGVDASPEMISRAKRKASKAGLEVRFQTAIVEELPFPDGCFDVVMSTLMLHHLPRPVREQCVREIRRVLKPGGRVLAVDFATPARERKSLVARFHRHGHMALRDIVELLNDGGLRVMESGAVGVSDLHFVVAEVHLSEEKTLSSRAPITRSFDPLPAPRWILPLLILVVLAAHGLVISGAATRLALPSVGIAAIVTLVVAMHSGFAGVIHAVLRRRAPPRRR